MLLNKQTNKKGSCTMTGTYWKEENTIKGSTQGHRRNFVILYRSGTFSPLLRNEKVLTYDKQCNIYIYLPTANTQNRWNESLNDTFDVFLPFAIFQKRLMDNFSYWDSSGPLSGKYSFQQVRIIFASPLTLLENIVLFRKLWWKFFQQ